MIKLETSVVDERSRETRVIFEEKKRYARDHVVRDPFLGTWRAIKNKYHVKTAVDFGCGMGVDIDYLLRLKIDAWGIDGSKDIQKVSLHPERFLVADLRNNIKIKGGVGLIHCREVAEHLPFRFSEVLVRNIVRNCRVCYFTAASPGQIGSGHINCQLRPFWLALFKKYGFTVDDELTLYNAGNNTNHLDRKNGFVVAGKRRQHLKMWV